MESNARLLYSALLISSILVVSCATSKKTFTNEWRDVSYTGHLGNVLVMGTAKEPVFRKMFEDEFVKSLKVHGTDAVASHTIVASDEMLDKEAILEKIKGQEVDTVLVTRLIRWSVKKETGDTYEPPPSYYRLNDYYFQSFGYGSESHFSRYSGRDEIILLETNLYDTNSEKLIWSGLFRKKFTEAVNKEIASFIKVVMKKLSDEKFVK
jgi:hypothetical protein